MTIALCLSCGNTKRGALCPCSSCGKASTGHDEIDVLFSDHQMSVTTLAELGGIIQRLAGQSDDADARFWAFAAYVSQQPAEILSVDPPPELAPRVAAILRDADLPIVDIDMTPGASEHLGHMVDVPRELFEAYARHYAVTKSQAIELRVDDGRTLRGMLVDDAGTPKVATRVESVPRPAQFVAIRKAPGFLVGWLVRRPWIEPGGAAGSAG